MGILLITHDLGIVAERSDHTYVMYAGRVVEDAPTGELLANPRHPYTMALLASLPQNSEPGKPLTTIPGQAPGLHTAMHGCGFCDRCPAGMDICRQELPIIREISPGHNVRCWK
jgi:peptide/nickel transport system ATP-binding protein